MNNKILVKFIFLSYEKSYDIYIPVNEYVWKIKRLVIKAVSDMNAANLNIKDDYTLINRDTGKIYSDNEIIIDSDIRNGCELFLVKM